MTASDADRAAESTARPPSTAGWCEIRGFACCGRPLPPATFLHCHQDASHRRVRARGIKGLLQAQVVSEVRDRVFAGGRNSIDALQLTSQTYCVTCGCAALQSGDSGTPGREAEQRRDQPAPGGGAKQGGGGGQTSRRDLAAPSCGWRRAPGVLGACSGSLPNLLSASVSRSAVLCTRQKCMGGHTGANRSSAG